MQAGSRRSAKRKKSSPPPPSAAANLLAASIVVRMATAKPPPTPTVDLQKKRHKLEQVDKYFLPSFLLSFPSILFAIVIFLPVFPVVCGAYPCCLRCCCQFATAKAPPTPSVDLQKKPHKLGQVDKYCCHSASPSISTPPIPRAPPRTTLRSAILCTLRRHTRRAHSAHPLSASRSLAPRAHSSPPYVQYLLVIIYLYIIVLMIVNYYFFIHTFHLISFNHRCQS